MKFPRLRQVGRAFYYDTQAKPRKWIALGSDEASALAKYRALYEARAPSGDTVDRMVAEYLDSIAGTAAPATLAQYRVWRRHLSAVFGHMRPQELTQADIAKYLALCPRKNARGEVSLLSGAYRRWLDLQRLTFNPCIGAKCRRPRPRRDRLLSDRELAAVLGESHALLALAIELAYATGLRISDLLALRWDQFGSGEPVQTRKTGARQRFEVNETLSVLLERARALQGRVASLYVLSGRGRQPLHRQTLGAWWRAACARAGVKDAKWHDIRAAAITEIKRQRGEQAAQEFAGHTSVVTTRVYLRDKSPTVVKPLGLARAR